jgi:hypothetical protein
MLTEYVHEQTRAAEDELRRLAHTRPRYDREVPRAPRMRTLLRRLALTPAKASATGDGVLPDVVIRPAAYGDTGAVARLAEASERRMPSGLVLVAEIEEQLVAALAVDERVVLTDLWRPTGDVVQLLELRTEQLRAAGYNRDRYEQVA